VFMSRFIPCRQAFHTTLLAPILPDQH